MRAPRTSALFALTSLAVVVGFAASGPAGCFYPDYTFDRPDGGAGPTGPTSTMHTTTSTGTRTTTTTSTSTTTATSTTSTSSAGGSAGQGGGGVGGGAGGYEDCTNGVDDNGNMLVDCSDPKCTAFSCINAIPTDWAGYFALYDGPPAQDPGCPSSFPSNVTPVFTGKGDMTSNPPVCECSCGTPTGEKCNYPTELDVFDVPDCNSDCVNDCCFALPLPTGFTDGACFDDMSYVGGTTCGAGHAADCNATPTGHGCSVSILVPPATVTGGTCAPTGPTLKPDPAVFQTLGRGCGDPPLTGMGCNSGQICLPKPKSPYVSGVCVSHDGDVPCPASQFTKKHTFFQKAADDRGCGGTCTCPDKSFGATCTASVGVFTNMTGTCGTEEAQSPFVSGTCTNLTGNPNLVERKAVMRTAPTGGGCTPDDSAVTSHGMATPDETTATTFCCVE